MRYGIAVLIGIALITPVTHAAEDSTEQYRQACIKALRITEELATVGTYGRRIDECIKDKQYAELTQSRTGRLQIRAAAVQERITRNSRARVYRVIPDTETVEERFDRFQQIYSPADAYRMLERNRINTRESIYDRSNRNDTGYERYQPQVTPSVLEKRITYTRPSRRLIKENALTQTRTERMETNDEYQAELLRALKTCSHIQNSFHRNNCIRSEQRKAGMQ